MKRFNELLAVIVLSLGNVNKMIKGLLVADENFQQICSELQDNRIPSIWLRRSYLTTKTLANYVNDLQQRVEFFKNWSWHGIPNAFWFSAFYFPQAIITTMKRTYSKRLSIDFDDIAVKVDVTTFDAEKSTEFASFLKV